MAAQHNPVTDSYLDETIVEVEDTLVSIDEEFTVKSRKSQKKFILSSPNPSLPMKDGTTQEEEEQGTEKKPTIKQSKQYKKLKRKWTRFLTELKWIKFRRFLDRNPVSCET